MKAPEEIFNHHASRIMKQFDMDNFKRDFPTLWKTIEESLTAMQSDHEKESAKHHDLLTEILEYMEAREDADGSSDGFTANKEMSFAIRIREMLKIN